MQRMPSSKGKTRTLGAWEVHHGPAITIFGGPGKRDSQERIMKTTDISIDFDTIQSKEAENDAATATV